MALSALPETTTFYSRPAILVALAKPLRFPPPMIEHATRPDGFKFWAHLIQYAFDVSDPADVLALPAALSVDDERIVRRYVQTAEDLSVMTMLNHAISFEVRKDADGNEYPAIDLGPLDARRGFIITFRQFYGDDSASFDRTHGILMKNARAATDGDAVTRIDHLTSWSTAVGASQARLVERTVLLEADRLGDHVATVDEQRFFVDRDTPARLLSAYFYGDDVHYNVADGHADAVNNRAAQSPMEDGVHRYQYMKAALGLAHLYLGYGKVAQTVASP